jgi:gas vesicle protein
MSRPESSTQAPGTGSSDPDEIRREIERTQAALSNDVDALTEKVSPARIAQRRVDKVRDTAGRWKDKVMGSNPLHHQSSGVVTGTYGGGGGPSTADRARDLAGTASDKAQSAAATAADKAHSVASSVGDTASQAASTVQGAVQEAPQAVVRQTRGNPLAAGLIAFGAGWLVSSLLPATRREQELAEQARERAGELGQPLAEKAKQVAGEVKENLQGPAQQAVESVKATATEAGQTVAEEGRSATQDVRDQAQDAAGTVRQNARS